MSELTQRVKAKYPQYANVPDAELEKRVLQKYPQYKQYVSPSIGGFASNVVKSGATAIKDTVGAVVNVINPDMEKNTIANLGRLGVDTAKLIAGDRSELNRASQVLNFYKQRYGGVDNIKETIYNDPVGFLLDASVVLGGAGAAVKGAGAAGKVSGLTKVGTTLSKAGAAIDPFMQAGKVAKVGFSKVANRLPEKLMLASESVATKGIGNPAAQAKAAKKAGRSVASFVDEYNLYDRSPDSASMAKRGIINQYDNLAMNSGKQVQMRQLVQAFDDEIAKLRGGVNGVVSDANQAKITELIRRKDQLLQASGGMIDANGQLISSPLQAGADTLTSFRRNVIDPDVPQSMFNLDARGSGAAQGVKQARDIVKSGIDSTDPRLAKLGKDYGMAKEVEKIFEQAQSRSNNRQLFNFTKLGSAGVGGITFGVPGAIGGMIAEQVVNTPRFLKLNSKALRSVAKPSQKLRQAATATSNTFAKGYKFGKNARVLSPDQKSSISTTGQILTQPPQETPVSYKPIVPPTTIQDPKSVKPLKYTPPKNVFSNKSTFGSTKKVTRGSFY